MKDAPSAYDAPAAIWAGLYVGGWAGFGVGNTSGRLKFDKRDEGDYEPAEVLGFKGESEAGSTSQACSDPTMTLTAPSMASTSAIFPARSISCSAPNSA